MSIAAHDTLAIAGGVDYDPTYNKDIYIDGNNGVDTNDGLTTATPIQTIQKAYSLFPIGLCGGGTVRIRLAGTGGTPFTAPASRCTYDIDELLIGTGGGLVINPVVYRGPDGPASMIRATLATGAAFGNALDNPLPAQRIDETGAPAVGGWRSELLFTVAAPGWTPHDMGPPTGAGGIGKSCFLRVTRGGLKVIPEMPIADNTATSIIVDSIDPAVNILVGDVVEIVWPSVLIRGATDFGGGIRVCVVKGIGAAAPSLAPLVFGNQGLTFERLAIEAPVVLAQSVQFDRCQLLGGTINQISVTNGGRVLFVNTTGGITSFSNNSAHYRAPQYPWSRPDTAANPVVPQSAIEYMCRILDIRSGSRYVAQQALSAYNSAAEGLGVGDRGSTFEQLAACPYLGGNANTTQGINAGDGGRVRIRTTVGPNAPCVITGGGGDIVCDGVTVAYGSGAGEFEEAIGYNGNLHSTTVAAGVPQGNFSQVTL